MPSETVNVGRVVKAHGIRGEMCVELWLNTGNALSVGHEISLNGSDGNVLRARIEASRPHQERILLTLGGITDRDMARSLVSAEIQVDRGDLPPLDEGEYLWEDLVGLSVWDEKGNALGKLTEVFSSGPGGENDVLVICKEDDEILLPMTQEVVKELDLDAGRLTVEVLEIFGETGSNDNDF